MKKVVLTICLMIAISGMIPMPAPAQDQTQDPFDAMEEAFDTMAAATESSWDAAAKAHEEAWNMMAARVEAIWGDQVMPSNKVWVDYDQDFEARSRVDFDKGEITIDVLVDLEEDNVVETGKNKLAQKFQDMLEEKDPATNDSILEGQLETAEGGKVRPDVAQQYIEQEVSPKATVEPKPIEGKDGKKRYKVSVSVGMVPDHLRVRAERYMPDIIKGAEKHQVSPALILAIIHTESSFNPKAHSKAGAYGLMQLIPRYGARDAYRFLHKRDRVIKGTELFDPTFNIELGSAYLHICFTRYLASVEDPVNREYMVICGYNWGPPMVKKAIAEKHNVNKMKNEELYEALMARIPNETKGYLKNVTKRKELYAMLFK